MSQTLPDDIIRTVLGLYADLNTIRLFSSTCHGNNRRAWSLIQVLDATFLDLSASSRFREVDEKNRLISKYLPLMTQLNSIDFEHLPYKMPLLTFVDEAIGGQLKKIRLGAVHDAKFLDNVNPAVLESYSCPSESERSESILTGRLPRVVELELSGVHVQSVLSSLSKQDCFHLKYLKIHADSQIYRERQFFENLAAISQKPAIRKIWLVGDCHWTWLVDGVRIGGARGNSNDYDYSLCWFRSIQDLHPQLLRVLRMHTKATKADRHPVPFCFSLWYVDHSSWSEVQFNFIFLESFAAVYGHELDPAAGAQTKGAAVTELLNNFRTVKFLKRGFEKYLASVSEILLKLQDVVEPPHFRVYADLILSARGYAKDLGLHDLFDDMKDLLATILSRTSNPLQNLVCLMICSPPRPSELVEMLFDYVWCEKARIDLSQRITSINYSDSASINRLLRGECDESKQTSVAEAFVGDGPSLSKILGHPKFAAGTIRDADKNYSKPCYAISYLLHKLRKKASGLAAALRNLLDLHGAIKPLERTLLVKLPQSKELAGILRSDDARGQYYKIYG